MVLDEETKQLIKLSNKNVINADSSSASSSSSDEEENDQDGDDKEVFRQHTIGSNGSINDLQHKKTFSKGKTILSGKNKS